MADSMKCFAQQATGVNLTVHRQECQICVTLAKRDAKTFAWE